MSNVTQLHSNTNATDRYKQGDIARALAEGLKHERIAADIEQTLSRYCMMFCFSLSRNTNDMGHW
jgi:hypothetical protein